MTTPKTSQPKRYKIVFEEPPRRGPNHGGLTDFLTTLNTKHPDRWVVIDRSMKTLSHLYYQRKHNFPNLEIRSRINTNKTFSVWIRMTSGPLPEKPVVAKKATKQPVKKAAVKVGKK